MVLLIDQVSIYLLDLPVEPCLRVESTSMPVHRREHQLPTIDCLSHQPDVPGATPFPTFHQPELGPPPLLRDAKVPPALPTPIPHLLSTSPLAVKPYLSSLPERNNRATPLTITSQPASATHTDPRVLTEPAALSIVAEPGGVRRALRRAPRRPTRASSLMSST